MNEKLARDILGAAIQPDDGLYYVNGEWSSWSTHDGLEIGLDGRFTAPQLEAMAWWMRNKGRP